MCLLGTIPGPDKQCSCSDGPAQFDVTSFIANDKTVCRPETQLSCRAKNQLGVWFSALARILWRVRAYIYCLYAALLFSNNSIIRAWMACT